MLPMLQKLWNFLKNPVYEEDENTDFKYRFGVLLRLLGIALADRSRHRVADVEALGLAIRVDDAKVVDLSSCSAVERVISRIPSG